MIMKNIFNIKTLLLALTLGVGAMMTGCDDDESLPKADALFRPIVNNRRGSMDRTQLGSL